MTIISKQLLSEQYFIILNEEDYTNICVDLLTTLLETELNLKYQNDKN